MTRVGSGMQAWLGVVALALCAAAALHAGEAEPPPEKPPEKAPEKERKKLPLDDEPGALTVPMGETEPPAGEGAEVEPAPDPKPDPDPAPDPQPDPVEEGDPAGETVELPTETPGLVVSPAGRLVPAPLDLGQVALKPERPEFDPDEPAVLLLTGPEKFLDRGLANYLLVDEYGREVRHGVWKLAEIPAGEDGVRKLSVDTAHALGGDQELRVNIIGGEDKRVERRVTFRLRRRHPWDRWMTLLHAPYGGGDWSRLRAMGVRGGMAYRLHGERLTKLRMAKVPFYVENVGREFLSRYHAERGLWEKTLEAVRRNPDAYDPLIRDPSLCSIAFARAYEKELKRHGRVYRVDRPLFYSLAAEPSMTRLAAAYDFDFHPEALKEFRRWLEREVYGTIGMLNTAWGTKFKNWNEVLPMTTDEARLRLRAKVMNFAPWVDFRSFLDHTFSKVLTDGGRVIRLEDPDARVGITGAMGPSAFGGWDWSRLAGALDVVEAYDIGGARALWRDLAPGKPALAMVPLAPDLPALREARRTMWTLALDGGPRGALLWDLAPGENEAAPSRVLLDGEGHPTPASEVLAPTLRELDGPLGMMLANARPEPPQVALLYSPASVRMHWLLEADARHGDQWLDAWGASTSRERRESPQLRLRVSWAKLLADLGLPWRFVSTAEVEDGILTGGKHAFKAVVLPRALCLSPKEVKELTLFAQEGGLLLADAQCGRYDEHGRMRKQPALDALFGVDTSREPMQAEPPRPLELAREFLPDGEKRLLSDEDLQALPPSFSDKPAWTAQGNLPPWRFEYRQSPLLARAAVGKGRAVFLNLNLDDYLLWRLKPERPRGRVLRETLAKLVFKDLLDALPEDLSAFTLPAGAEILRLKLGTGEAAPRILALRRNVQERLHELGREGDSNRAFEQAERFKLALRQPAFVSEVLADKPTRQVQVIEGMLDPVTPSLFILRAKGSLPPAVTAPATVKAGEVLELKILRPPGMAEGPRVYGLTVSAPDRTPRDHYNGAWLAPDGTQTVQLPIALNDPPGDWTLLVRDVTTGHVAKLVVTVEK